MQSRPLGRRPALWLWLTALSLVLHLPVSGAAVTRALGMTAALAGLELALVVLVLVGRTLEPGCIPREGSKGSRTKADDQCPAGSRTGTAPPSPSAPRSSSAVPSSDQPRRSTWSSQKPQAWEVTTAVTTSVVKKAALMMWAS